MLWQMTSFAKMIILSRSVPSSVERKALQLLPSSVSRGHPHVSDYFHLISIGAYSRRIPIMHGQLRGNHIATYKDGPTDDPFNAVNTICGSQDLCNIMDPEALLVLIWHALHFLSFSDHAT
jgi:hypothetical protein